MGLGCAVLFDSDRARRHRERLESIICMNHDGLEGAWDKRRPGHCLELVTALRAFAASGSRAMQIVGSEVHAIMLRSPIARIHHAIATPRQSLQIWTVWLVQQATSAERGPTQSALRRDGTPEKVGCRKRRRRRSVQVRVCTARLVVPMHLRLEQAEHCCVSTFQSGGLHMCRLSFWR
jgi:hypothetical protein